jgi:hypothetical protein
MKQNQKQSLNTIHVYYYSVPKMLSHSLLHKHWRSGHTSHWCLGSFYMTVNCIPLLWWEEHILQLFENKVLRKTFGPKNVVWSNSWYNRNLYNLHRSSNIVRLVKSLENQSLWSTRKRWENTIKMNLKEEGHEDVRLMSSDRLHITHLEPLGCAISVAVTKPRS